MFDIGWQEIFLIGVVALVVVGPKDLPKALRVVAHAVRKGRALSREFQNGLAEMMREAELEELKHQIKRSSRFDIEKSFKDTVDPTGRLSAEFDPAEFAREIRERVDGTPPKRPTNAGSESAEAANANEATPKAAPSGEVEPPPRDDTQAEPPHPPGHR